MAQVIPGQKTITIPVSDALDSRLKTHYSTTAQLRQAIRTALRGLVAQKELKSLEEQENLGLADAQEQARNRIKIKAEEINNL